MSLPLRMHTAYATALQIRIFRVQVVYSSHTQRTGQMSFPNKDERAKCWANRDAYWQCLDEHAPKHSSTSGEKVPDVCAKLRKAFEGSCPSQWVKHFDRKRTYEQFKQRMEKGFDPLEEKARLGRPRTT